MTEPQLPDIVAYNAQSLRALSRAIDLSKGRFSLILVRCNYTVLQHQMRQQLKAICPVAITEMELHDSTKTLYTAIKTEIGEIQPEALMVLGLDSVKALENVLSATNKVRNEFQKSFAFPLLLWMNDETFKKLARLAPDFNSWAGVPIRFMIAPKDLMSFLQQQTDVLFAKIAHSGAGRFPRSSALYDGVNAYSAPELKAALKDLQNQQQPLEPELRANLDFILGVEAYTQEAMAEAKRLYEQSLRFWQTALNPVEFSLDSTKVQPVVDAVSPSPPPALFVTPLDPEQRSLYISRKACVLFYLGLWWRRQAVLNRAAYELNCLKARDYYKKCIETLQDDGEPSNLLEDRELKDSTITEHQTLIANFILALGEVLQRLGVLYNDALAYITDETFSSSDIYPLFNKEQYQLKHRAIWDELIQVAQISVDLHQRNQDFIRLAYSYGLQSEALLAGQNWLQAKQHAEQALEVNDSLPNETPESQNQYWELRWALRHYRSLYLLLLAQAEWELDQLDQAIVHLEESKGLCNDAYDPLLFTRILATLQRFYYHREDYLKAFNTKQEQRSIEQQYGIRAFVGAGRLEPELMVINPVLIAMELPDELDGGSKEFTYQDQPIAVAQEIIAAGRDVDVGRLIERLGRDDHKLTIIHGQSGVGKSSIINAGLVPKLKGQEIGGRNVLTIVLDGYTDWARELGDRLLAALINVLSPDHDDSENPQELGKQLSTALKGHDIARKMPDFGRDSNDQSLIDQLLIDSLINQLRSNGDDHSLLTVLIFDQFEEFFFYYGDSLKRRPFFEFFDRCLHLSFVKIVLSLRDDCLHYLLECDRREIPGIDNDVLGRARRYPLGNFPPDRARTVIEHLTQRSQFVLHKSLIKRLVEDLSKELGEVRPIELQVVGVELQEQHITTLQQYKNLGENPKEKLVENFLKRLAEDCGGEKAQLAARRLLYLLTDEKGTRPIRTWKELSTDLPKVDVEVEQDQLNQILKILVDSGIVLLLKDPIERYQLVHDYLVSLVRKEQGDNLREEIAQKNKEIHQLEENGRKDQIQSLKTGRSHARIIAILSIGAACMGIVFGVSNHFKEQQRAIAELQSTTSQAAALLLSHDELGSLIASARAARQLESIAAPLLLRVATLAQMQQTLYSIHENNRLIGHSSSVNDISFSPDGQLIASASDDYTVRLWEINGTPVSADKTSASAPKQHISRVNSIDFSPDSQMLVSASDDGTLKLWQRNGQVLPISLRRPTQIYGAGRTSQSYDAIIGDFSYKQARFSPDGERIVGVSADGNLTFWKRNGDFIKTFSADPEWVTAISFSPDGQRLASAGWDGTVKLWDSQGNFQDQLDHMGKVRSVSFSPDGQVIASGGADRVIKLWSKDGQLLQELTGHIDDVTSLSFNKSSSILVSLSQGQDAEMRFWQRADGSGAPKFVEIEELRRDTGFLSAHFSPYQDNLLAIANGDNTIRLWNLNGSPQKSHPLGDTSPNGISFSPNGQIMAIAGTHSDPGKNEGNEGELILLNVQNMQNVQNSQIKRFALGGRLESVQFSRDGTLIIGAENFSPKLQNGALSTPDGQIKLWNANGNLQNSFSVVQTPQAVNSGLTIKDVQLSPDGKTIAAAVTKNISSGAFLNPQVSQIILFDIGGQLKLPFQSQNNSEITKIGFNPLGDALVSGDTNHTVKVWNLQGKLLATLSEHNSPVTSVEFSPNGHFIASASQDTTIKLWRWSRGQKGESESLHTLSEHIGSVLTLKFSADSRVLASASSDGVIKLWDVDSGTSLATLQSSDSAISGLSFSPDGQLLTSVGADNMVNFWDFEPRKLLRSSCDWLANYLRNNSNINQDKGQPICSYPRK